MAKAKTQKQDADAAKLARLAANAAEAAEDIGEFDLEDTLDALEKDIDLQALARELVGLGSEFLRIMKGASDIAPDRKDWRFSDDAWNDNPFYKRLGQSYLAFTESMKKIVRDDDDWRSRERAKFVIEVITSALAPTNTLAGNPAAIKEVVNSGGLSLVKGLKHFVEDLSHNHGMPRMVDDSAFVKGENIAATPGAVIFRNQVLELMQYTPTTAKVHSVPVLLVPSQINKYYFTDLAPGRSLVEYAVSHGVQIFVVSWVNPTAADGDWDLDTYVSALYEAVDAMLSITRARNFNAIGFCAGGITLSCLAAHMGAQGDERLNSISYAVTLLDWNTEAMVGMLHSEHLITVAKRRSQDKGLIKGKDLGRLFAWFRPNELIWNYWVNNYLMGKNPPSFDILAWNADSTDLPAALHGQFLDLFLHNAMVSPGQMEVLNTPIDLANITADAFITGARTDHLTPWQGCYKTTQLLGSKNREFVLSNAGHIASLINPPGNPKASYYLGPEPNMKAEEWERQAIQKKGSWWEQWLLWLSERSGTEKKAPESLGNKKYPALETAPGLYIHG